MKWTCRVTQLESSFVKGGSEKLYSDREKIPKFSQYQKEDMPNKVFFYLIA